MTTIVGDDGVVSIGGTAVAELKSWSLEENAEQIDDTAMGDSYKTSKSGKPSATGTFECHYDASDATQQSLTAGAAISLVLYPNGTGSGSPRITLASAVITGRSQSGAIGAIVGRTFNFGLTDGTVVHDNVT